MNIIVVNEKDYTYPLYVAVAAAVGVVNRRHGDGRQGCGDYVRPIPILDRQRNLILCMRSIQVLKLYHPMMKAMKQFCYKSGNRL